MTDIREPVTREAVRADTIVAIALAFVAAALAALSTVSGLYAQTNSAPLWASIAASAALSLPLALRRRWPAVVALVQAALYITFGSLGAVEIYTGQVVLFIGFYSIGAWDANRTRAHWVRLAISAAMAVWLTISAIIGFSSPETGERGVAAFFAIMAVQVAINAAFFAGAWVFGDRAWKQAAARHELEQAHAQLRTQQGQLAEQAVSLERVRIARELHDVVAHHVSAMGVQAGAARRVLATDQDAASVALRHVEQSARDAIGELRSLVGALRSDDVDDDTSRLRLDAVPTLVAAALDAGSAASFQIVGSPRSLSPAVELALYRAAQEGLTNARKHAPGAPVDVRLRYESGAVELEVSDEGHGGRDPSTTRQAGTGLGLIGMRERMSAVGGTLEAGRKSRGGWLVRARVDAR